MGVKVQKSALQTLFNFAKVWAAHQPHVHSRPGHFFGHERLGGWCKELGVLMTYSCNLKILGMLNTTSFLNSKNTGALASSIGPA